MSGMDDLKKKMVTGPDGKQFEVDPINDYYCSKKPEVIAPANPYIEKFYNWARANSLWVLGWGTGCGSIEIPPLVSPRLSGFIALKKRIKEGKGEGANEYAEKFEWYKANQKKVIKQWDMPDYNW